MTDVENIKIESKEGTMVVSSREVAENFEKRHDHILRDIRNNIEANPILGTPQYFIESNYINPQNKQEYQEYLITEKGFSLLVMGFTGKKALEWKIKYIDAFEKMREYINSNPHKLPTNFKEALQLLLVEVEEKEKLQVQVKELQAPANFAKTIVKSENSITMGTMAKLLNQNGINIGRNRLIDVLKEEGYLMETKDGIVPTQKSRNAKVIEVEPYKIKKINQTKFTSYITANGIPYFMGKFLNGKIGQNN